ncbi:hypothetical protein CCO02nite_09860 [Cellulomonas composti]|uniref:Uncharacterized protein n=1 Tax=Cellulomonas composti TaxID=266130 RepID=A0A511J8L2_9CELL|nr:hypothetical protein CCO02nite_09860 [Cellulomonas composti]
MLVLEVLGHRRDVGRALQPQGPSERATAGRELEAARIWVQPRTPTRHPAPHVHDKHGSSRLRRSGDHPQQGRPRTSGSAPDARANGAHHNLVGGHLCMQGAPGFQPSVVESTPAAHRS